MSGSYEKTDRYSRQILFEPIGAEGQKRLGRARVTLIGCGALGSVIANTLVRAGVGFLRICDRDYIELNNLQRQVLFDEADIEQNLPKAVAAERKLALINSETVTEGVVTDVTHENIESLIHGADLILDGTDNLQTRYLINDASVMSNTPWIYGAVLGAEGLVMAVLPNDTPCLRCVFEEAPPPEMTPTCDTAGIIAPAVNMVASLEVVEAIKILTGQRETVVRQLTSIDAWAHRLTRLNVGKAKSTECPCCGLRRFDYLDGKMTSSTTMLCGHDAVQVKPPMGGRRADLKAVARKLEAVADEPVTSSDFMVRARVGEYGIAVFGDGRAIIKGARNLEEAKSVYARYIGG